MATAKLIGAHSYSQCLHQLQGRGRMKIGHNTYIETRDSAVAVKYHHTDIVTYHSDGRITVRTGGWDTATTRGRLRDLLNYRVFCDHGGIILDAVGVRYPLEDTVEIDAKGEITNVAPLLAIQIGNFLKMEINSKEELVNSIKRLALEQMIKVWKKFNKDRGFLARYCLEEFLPLTLADNKAGSEPWIAIVTNRLKGTANA